MVDVSIDRWDYKPTNTTGGGLPLATFPFSLEQEPPLGYTKSTEQAAVPGDKKC